MANSVCSPTRCFSTALVMVELLAVASTSALLPWSREVTRSWDPWKSNLMVRSGLSALSLSPISWKTPLREAAASTVISPLTLPAAAVVDGASEGAEEEVVVEEVPPHATSEAAERRESAVIARRRERRMGVLSGSVGLRGRVRGLPPRCRAPRAPPPTVLACTRPDDAVSIVTDGSG